MNILLVGPSLAQRGGVVSVLRGLRDFLMVHDVAVRVVATTACGRRWRGVLAFLRAWATVLGTCFFRRYDVVHLHMASRGSCLRKSILGLTCWVFHMPFVIHLHGAEFRSFHDDEMGPIGRMLVGFVFRRAVRVISLSIAWKSWLEIAMKLKHVVVVFNGVPTLLTANDLTANDAEARPTVLFLGRLGARKGTGELISAMKEVAQMVPDVVLELGGDGDIEAYRQQAVGLPNVHFLGWLDDVGRRAALARATVYCLPSWNEGLPMSVLEAMSAGLPVVSTPVGGVPEAVEDGVTGLLIQPGDVPGLSSALCQLLLNPSMAKSLGRNGHTRHREQFSTEAMGRGCLEVYASCVNH